MSIIYDALKKVENNINKDNPTQAQASVQAKAKAKFRPVFLYIFIVSLVLFLGNFAFNFFSLPKKTIPPTLSPPLPPPPPAAKEAPAVTTSIPVNPTQETNNLSEPDFVLNGVFFEQGNGYALINNSILRVGDEIGHAKVKQITLRSVELEFEGKTIKLASPS